MLACSLSQLHCPISSWLVFLLHSWSALVSFLGDDSGTRPSPPDLTVLEKSSSVLANPLQISIWAAKSSASSCRVMERTAGDLWRGALFRLTVSTPFWAAAGAGSTDAAGNDLSDS